MTHEDCRRLPNVAQIRSQATRVIRGRVPAGVRRELSEGVRLGLIGHLRRDGLKPEIIFHPDHRNGAIERQVREAIYAVECIRGVVAHPMAAET